MDFAKLGFDIDSGDVRRSDRDVKSFTGSVKKAGSETTTFGTTAKKGFGMVSVAALAATGAILGLGSGIQVIKEFGSSVSSLEAVSRASAAEMELLESTARRMGATTKFSAGQAADGLTFLAMAGFSANEAAATLPATLNLAAAANLGLAESADIASNIMSAFSISASESSEVADVLAAAASSANTNVMQLGDAMKFVGPVASALNVEMSESAAAIGVLSDAGIQGGMAGTALRRILSSLIEPTGAAKDAIESLGITVEDVNPETVKLTDIIDRLASSGLGASEALTIFGDRGGPAILALTSQNESLRELTEELENVEGRALSMADTMNDNLKGDILTLVSATQELILSLGDAGLTAVLRSTIQMITDVVRIVSQVVNAFERLTGSIRETLGLVSAQEQLARASQEAANAINEEIAKSDVLNGSLSDGRQFSLDIAGVKLAQAQAHLSVATAIREEELATIRNSAAYRDAVEDQAYFVEAIQEYYRLRDQYGEEGAGDAERLRMYVDMLQNAVERQRVLLQGASELSPEYHEAQRNIELLRQAILNAVNGTVTLGNETKENVETTVTLARVAGGVNFQGAILSAGQLAEKLGTSLRIAQAISRIGGNAGASGPDEAIQQVRSAYNMADLIDQGLATVQVFDSTTSALGGGGGGGGGGLSEAMKQYNDRVSEGESLTESLRTETEKYADDLENIKSLMEEGHISQETFNRALADMNETLIQSDPLMSGVLDAVEGMVDGSIDSLEDLARMGEQIIRQFLANIARQFAAQQLGLNISVGAPGGLGGASGIASGVLGSVGQGGSLLSAGVGSSGLIGGLSQSLSGGLGGILNIGANAAAAGGGLAATVGAAIPVLGAAAVVFSGLRTKTKELDAGLELTFRDLEVTVDQFEKLQKSRFFGLSKSTSINTDSADSETSRQIELLYGDTVSNVLDLADGLNVGKKALKGFSHEVSFSTKDMTDAQIQQQIVNNLGVAQNKMSKDILQSLEGSARLQRRGETATEALATLSETMQVTGDVFRRLGGEALDFDAKGVAASRRLVEMSGGIEAFTQSSEFFYQNFFTDREKFQNTRKQLNKGLREAGISDRPDTVEEFRATYDRLLRNGRNSKATQLMNLSPLFLQMEEFREAMKASSDATQEEARIRSSISSAARSSILQIRGETQSIQDTNLSLSQFRLRRAINRGRVGENRLLSLFDGVTDIDSSEFSTREEYEAEQQESLRLLRRARRKFGESGNGPVTARIAERGIEATENSTREIKKMKDDLSEATKTLSKIMSRVENQTNKSRKHLRDMNTLGVKDRV